jgi:hypothetical protein
MLQSVHIFRKDARHLWPEILVTLILFAAFAWSAPSHWTGSVYAGILGLLSALLHVLLPLAWLVLISRAVHDETLVGDRQFWTSRPYHWASLLGAKILFVLAFIYLPFLLVQAYLVKHAGLYPTTVVPALLHNLLLLTVAFILPILTLAAVTSTFTRLLVTLLGAIVYLVILGAVLGWLSWGRMAPPHLSAAMAILFLALLGSVLVYQYAVRRTDHARIALAAIPLIIFIAMILLPTNLLIHANYRPLDTSAGLRLTPIPDGLRPHPDSAIPLQTFRNSVLLLIPMQVAGIDENSLYRIDGYAATIDGPNGFHWTSPWQAAGNDQINASTPATGAQIPMSLDVYQKIRNTPVNVHLTLALDHLKVGAPYTVTATQSPFPIPGRGLCSFESVPGSADDAAYPVCRFPFEQPDNTFISAPMSVSSCASAPSAAGRGNFGSGGQSFSFDPVQTVPLNLRTGDPDPQHRYLLCPSTKIAIFQAQRQGRNVATLDLQATKLDGYAERLNPPAAVRQRPQAPTIPE